MTVYLWVILVLFYGISKGVRDGLKKLSMQKSSLMEVLLFHSLLAFIFTIPFSKNIFGMPPVYYPLIFLKSFVIFLAWIFSFKSIRKMPLSYFGIIDMSRVIFSTCLGVFLIGETMKLSNIIGLILVLIGLFAVNIRKDAKKGEKAELKYVVLTFVACLLNAVSGTMDKIYTKDVTPGQLQFWYMFFMVALYIIYVIATQTKVRFSVLKNNIWIWILSVLFVLADRALFIANSMEGSQVTIMTLIKQSSVIVTILFGKFVFKEKNILFKLLCSAIIIVGIMISVI